MCDKTMPGSCELQGATSFLPRQKKTGIRGTLKKIFRKRNKGLGSNTEKVENEGEVPL